MNAEVWYLDSSALVKAVVEEAESSALADWLRDKDRLAACELVRVETVRAVRVWDAAAVPRARQAVGALILIRLDDDLYEMAADLEPPFLRSLDAIHLAAALSMGRDLAGVVTYDGRMAEGARARCPGRGAGSRRARALGDPTFPATSSRLEPAASPSVERREPVVRPTTAAAAGMAPGGPSACRGEFSSRGAASRRRAIAGDQRRALLTARPLSTSSRIVRPPTMPMRRKSFATYTRSQTAAFSSAADAAPTA
ncbi:MAG: type II toxin-antitoxin system VapC family toxin, partial [Thermoleophilaceae bacterium]